jgi:hypothetical protein
MSSIIDADPFNNVFTATKGNSTMQGVVTAIYELGEYSQIESHGDIRLIHDSRLPWRRSVHSSIR